MRVQSPALVGWIRPKLLLPQAVIDDFDPTELRMIFLHELAHQKRRDVLVNWLASGLQVVHWFNPLVWLVMWRVRTDREVACDELVLSLTRGADRRAYGRTILKLLETLPDGRVHGAFAPAAVAGTGVGILEGKHQMKRRITMIAQVRQHDAALDGGGGTARTRARRRRADRRGAGTGAATRGTTAGHCEGPRGQTRDGRCRCATGPGAVEEDPANLTARAALDKRLPEVRFDAVGFEEAVNFLRDVTGANIYVNWRAWKRPASTGPRR